MADIEQPPPRDGNQNLAAANSAPSGGDNNPPQKALCAVCHRFHSGRCLAEYCGGCAKVHKMPAHFCEKCKKCCGHTTAEHRGGRVSKKTKARPPPSRRPVSAPVWNAQTVYNFNFSSAEAVAQILPAIIQAERSRVAGGGGRGSGTSTTTAHGTVLGEVDETSSQIQAMNLDAANGT